MKISGPQLVQILLTLERGDWGWRASVLHNTTGKSDSVNCVRYVTNIAHYNFTKEGTTVFVWQAEFTIYFHCSTS